MSRSSLWVALALLASLTLQSVLGQHNCTWEEIQNSKKGTVTIYWFPNEPFGYQSEDGRLKGIEVDIVNGFRQYLEDRYRIDLSFNWIKVNTFKEVMDRIRQDTTGAIFGVAGFSFSAERKMFMKFSPSYMADMAVLVSTQDIPIVRSSEDLKKYFDDATALTAQGTILEKDLIALREENNLHFTIEYTGGSDELIEVLRKRKKSFGYLNLPIYLMDLDRGLTQINRQNFLTKRYEGRGIGLPKISHWDEPFREYFESPDFKNSIESIIGQYINIDLYHFVETLNPENEIGLLNREKSLQLMQLKVQELTIRKKNERQIFLTAIIIVVSILLLVIIVQYRKQRKSNALLHEQKAEIEAQSDHIRSINDNLEVLIRERTRELQAKNKALEEYAFITAHKLRAPLASILGLVTLIEKLPVSEQDEVIIRHLGQSARRLDEIIHTVMDAIDRSDNPEKNPE